MTLTMYERAWVRQATAREEADPLCGVCGNPMELAYERTRCACGVVAHQACWWKHNETVCPRRDD